MYVHHVYVCLVITNVRGRSSQSGIMKNVSYHVDSWKMGHFLEQVVCTDSAIPSAR